MPDDIIPKNNNMVETTKVKSKPFFATLVWGVLALLLVAASFLGYMQLAKIHALMSSDISAVGSEAQDSSKKLSDLTQTVNEMQKTLQLTLDATKKETETLAQDKSASELYARLSQLDNLIDQLPVPAMQATQTVETKVVDTQKLSWWQAAWMRLSELLGKFVTVKYIGKDVPPLVGPIAQNYLYQNLHSQVENAMWAVLHFQPEVYEMSVTRMSTWVKRYFTNDAPETIAVLQELEALTKVTMAQSAPAL